MKYLILTILFSYGLSIAYAGTCVDVTNTMSRGDESSQVKLLQQFLVEKGYLQAAPNGYFGGGTFSALKQYQKSNALMQTGTVGPMTRATLKKDSCQAVPSTSTSTSPVAHKQATTTSATTTGAVTPSAVTQPVSSNTSLPAPSISSVDKVTLFSGGTIEWSPTLYGTGFGTTSSAVFFKSQANQKKYFIGLATSTDGKTLTLPKNITGTALFCGPGCVELIPPGDYDVSVVTMAGESNTIFMSIKSFTISAITGTLSTAIPFKVSGARIGTVILGSSVAFKVTNITQTVTTAEGFKGGSISGFVFKDEQAGKTFVYNDQNAEVMPNQSKIVGLYGDVSTQVPGRVLTSFKVTVQDYIGNKKTTFTSPQITTSISQ